jgi:branched-chain amino acid transport system ATP-binding protein
VAFEVERGEIVALLGNNGAGKTTTLKTISGLLIPRGGGVSLEGESLTGRPPHEVVQKGIAHVPEGRRIFNRLTVRENLLMGAYRRRDAGVAGDLERVLTLFPRLRERLAQVAGTLSGGEQQMVAIARGLMARPRLLMIDEPFLGLAPQVVQSLGEVIRRIHADGITVIFVEQNVELALRLAHRGYVLESGRTVVEGPSAELLRSSEVKRIFLGDEAVSRD